MKKITGATIALLSMVALPALAAENIITVNALSSSNATVDDSFCTLHEAIKAANDNANNADGCAAGSALDDDIIEFDVATVEITNGMPNIKDGLTIRGPVTINAAVGINPAAFMIRTAPNFDPGERLVLQDVSIVDSTLDNPVIFINNDADQIALDIIGGTFSNNTNSVSNGGVLSVSGNVEVNLNSVTLTDNEATTGTGGAIALSGNVDGNPTLNLQGGSFAGNKSLANYGGAISMDEPNASAEMHVINGTTFSGNESTSDSGAIDIVLNGSSLSISNASFIGNKAAGAGGAVGFFSNAAPLGSSLSCTACTFSGNETDGVGGAVFFGTDAADDTLTITSSTFDANSTIDAGGNHGGALAIEENTTGGQALVVDSTFSNNTSGRHAGAVFCTGGNDQGLRVVNSTFSGNTSNLDGGALRTSCDVSLNNVTVTNNTAGAGNADADAGLGGGIRRNGGSVTVQNSVVAANNIGTADLGEDCSGDVTSAGYNFIGTDTDCAYVPAAGDTVGGAPSEDPMLGMLASNGGSTETHLPMAGSPLIDAGNPAGCDDGAAVPALLTDDQTGATRPVNGQCDIGAVEVQLDPPAPTGNTVANNGAVAPTDVAAGDAGVEALGLILTNTSGETVDFTSLTLAATGDANAASDITAVTLYADTNCDGDLDGGDVNLGSAPGFGTFNFASQTVASGGQLCFVVTVDTNVTLAALVMPMFAASSLMLIGMMGLGGFGGRRKLLTVLLAAGVFSLAGCHGDDDDGAGAGGGGGGGGGPATATYTVTATAVGGTGQTSNKAASVSGLPTSGQAITITEP